MADDSSKEAELGKYLKGRLVLDSTGFANVFVVEKRLSLRQ